MYECSTGKIPFKFWNCTLQISKDYPLEEHSKEFFLKIQIMNIASDRLNLSVITKCTVIMFSIDITKRMI